MLVIDTRPKPLVLTLRADGTIVGPGPVTIDGVVAGGYTAGSSTPGHTETSQTTTHQTINQNQAGAYSGSQLTYQGNGQYDAATTTTHNTYVPGTSTPGYTNFVPKRATCPALNLSSKGAGVGIQTMQTDLLKTMFGGGQRSSDASGNSDAWDLCGFYGIQRGVLSGVGDSGMWAGCRAGLSIFG